MPNPDYLEQLQGRLLKLGCPRTRTRRLVREIADHRDDLVQTAIAAGLPTTAAQARANVQLGDPLTLAGQLMATLRRSSWWGRHSFIAFCLLPLLAFPLLWALLMYLGLLLEFAVGYHWDSTRIHLAADNPVQLRHLNLLVHSLDLTVIALVTLLFCWLARRSVVSLKWMLTAGLICSLYATFSWIWIAPHHLSAGISLHPHWPRATASLLITGLVCAFHWRTTRLFHEPVAN